MTPQQILLIGVIKDFTGLVRALSDEEVMNNRKLPSRTAKVQKLFILMAERYELGDWLNSIRGVEGNRNES